MEHQNKLDQNRVALLADTRMGADPNLSYPGTKWPGSSPVPQDEHESVNMAKSLADVAKNRNRPESPTRSFDHQW